MALGVPHKVAEFCRKNALLTKKDRIVIGVSGGPDSLCLLHLLTTLRSQFELSLIIAHLNHQLRGTDSQADEDFVREIAARWRLPIFVDSRNIAAVATKHKQSIEEAARQVRYAFLWRIAQETGANKIAVGHNADDQVETVLMHFLRGTGLAGLRGMLPQIDIASLRLLPEEMPAPFRQPSPKLIRPLLEISRAEIESYCQENGLSPRQDYSNQDTTFFRNRLRHELIPELETYNPNVRQILQHTAKVVAADTEILSDQLDKAWYAVIKNESGEEIVFDLVDWLRLPLAMKRSTLRRAVQILRCSLRDINFTHIENAIDVLERGGTGAKATLPQGLMLTVGYQTFTVAPEMALSSPRTLNEPHLLKGQVLELNLPGVTPLPHTNWQLKADLLSYESLAQEKIKQVSRWEAYLDAGVIGSEAILRPRQPGDRFCPLGLTGHSKKVNEFMINEKIPARWRDFIPLLVSNKRVLWVCGYRPDERAGLGPTTQRVLHLRFERQ